MTKPESNINWQQKGFGWIPDLPDITDPSLTLALENKTQILTSEGIGRAEEVAISLIKILKGKKVIKQDEAEEIQGELFGDTRFPDIQVYKILRKGVSLQGKEILQLRQALYWFYQELVDNHESSSHRPILDKTLSIFKQHEDEKEDVLKGKDKIVLISGLELIKWFQNSDFDGNLQKLVIDFQARNNLIADGIVGLKTYTAIQSKLTKNEKPSPEIRLLCPPSLIPHDILREIFQNLTYIWLSEQFESRINRAFQSLYEKHQLGSMQIEYIQGIKMEMAYLVDEQLQDVCVHFRNEIDGFISKDNKIKECKSISILSRQISRIRYSIIKKLCELLSSSRLNLQENKKSETRENSDAMEDLPIIKNILAELELLIRDNLIDFKDLDQDTNRSAFKVKLENSFIIYPSGKFIEQFHLWFHVIEPFASGFLQILSPIANFDNYKQAVRSGFERLDGCFQLYQLENKSRISNYKALFLEYSSLQLSDHVDELQILRRSLIGLFQETRAKIDRTLEEDLDFRGAIVCALKSYLNDRFSSFLKSKRNAEQDSLKDAWPEFVNNLPCEAPKAFLEKVRSNTGIKRQKEKIDLYINPIAIRIYSARVSTLKKDIENTEEWSLTKVDQIQQKFDQEIQQKLMGEENNITKYLRFFHFLNDILGHKYGVNLNAKGRDFNLSIDHQEDSEASVNFLLSEQNRVELRSLLTAKKELFEIVDLDSSKWEGSNRSSSESDASLFFKPMALQLPVNANLLREKSKEITENEKAYFFLPGAVDLSYWCPPVEDQGNLNACTAFAGVSLLEYFAQKSYGKYTNLSARFLYKVARNLMNRSDDTGASVRQTIKALALFGVPPEEVWPWGDDDFNEEPPAFCYAYGQSYQALKYFRLDAPNASPRNAHISSEDVLLFQIKAVLAAGLPCIFGFTVYSSFYKEKNIQRGYIPYPGSRDQMVGGHAAVAVGYNDYKLIHRIDGKVAKPGAILIRNSWGIAWGDGGYGWLPYEYILEGLTADWWSLLNSEWFNGGAFGLGAVDPGERKPTDPPSSK